MSNSLPLPLTLKELLGEAPSEREAISIIQSVSSQLELDQVSKFLRELSDRRYKHDQAILNPIMDNGLDSREKVERYMNLRAEICCTPNSYVRVLVFLQCADWLPELFLSLFFELPLSILKRFANFDLYVSAVGTDTIDDFVTFSAEKINPMHLLYLWSVGENIDCYRLALGLSEAFLNSEELTTSEDKLDFIQEAAFLSNGKALNQPVNVGLKFMELDLIEELKIKHNFRDAPDDWIKEMFHTNKFKEL